MNWAATYDAILDMNNPSDAGFNSQDDADKFTATGLALAERLRHELGPEYKVVTYIDVGYKPSATDPHSS